MCLPFFTPDRPSGVDFTMKVVGGDVRQQLVEDYHRRDDGADREAVAVDGDFDGAVFVHPSLSGKRTGNPDRQAVPPFLHFRLHFCFRDESTMKIHMVAPLVNRQGYFEEWRRMLRAIQ